MSAVNQAALVAPAPLRARAPGRRLRAVETPAPRRRPRMAYAIVALAGALAIGAAQMSLSILTTQSSYELSSLTQQDRQLTWQKQIVHDEIAGLSSPQFLAANASALGMVIAESPNYLRLSDGQILGSGDAALGASSIDALSRGAVPNALIQNTPLVTEPTATIEGVPAVDPAVPADGIVNTPPPLTDGLPTPATH